LQNTVEVYVCGVPVKETGKVLRYDARFCATLLEDAMALMMRTAAVSKACVYVR